MAMVQRHMTASGYAPPAAFPHYYTNPQLPGYHELQPHAYPHPYTHPHFVPASHNDSGVGLSNGSPSPTGVIPNFCSTPIARMGAAAEGESWASFNAATTNSQTGTNASTSSTSDTHLSADVTNHVTQTQRHTQHDVSSVDQKPLLPTSYPPPHPAQVGYPPNADYSQFFSSHSHHYSMGLPVAPSPAPLPIDTVVMAAPTVTSSGGASRQSRPPYHWMKRQAFNSSNLSGVCWFVFFEITVR